MITKLEYLFRVVPPWISVGLGEPERQQWIPSYFYTTPGLMTCVRVLRGKKMRTTAALMDEFAAALQFFQGFGENWYALADCLQALNEWLPAEAYILVVENAEEMLRDESSDSLTAAIKTLHEVGEAWARPVSDNGRFNRPPIPFHTLLNVSESSSARVKQVVEAARSIDVPLRISK